MSTLSSCLGFPRIGDKRQLKKSVENFWAGEISADDLQSVAAELRKTHWLKMQECQIDHIPCNDFTFYDHMLDMAVCVGAVPQRYKALGDELSVYFAMARGIQDSGKGIDLAALEMTKWFDTNYHYIVPELEENQQFELNPAKILSELTQARDLGIEPRIVIPGPVTFLALAKFAPDVPESANKFALLDGLLSVYAELLALLKQNDVKWVQFDEPILVTDLDDEAKAATEKAFAQLSGLSQRPEILLATYFGALEDNLSLASESGFEALHIDLVRAQTQLDAVLDAVKSEKLKISLGLINGRNIWRADLDKALAIAQKAAGQIGTERLIIGPSCSLLHSPVDLDSEEKLDSEIKNWLAFATQKLQEIQALTQAVNGDKSCETFFAAAREAITQRNQSPLTNNPDVKKRLDAVTPEMIKRNSPFNQRKKIQQEKFQLPPLPTTTIGSFPQTPEIRKARSQWRKGQLSDSDYEKFLQQQTIDCLRRQEQIGLDVLVHGEYERNDMVEYFGEQLEGFAFTQFGWVQSYGSRCVKPPVLFGDVWRPEPMTVQWSSFAQKNSDRPVKGMLTGPITILQWSFVRDDQPRSETCRQIALALRDELADLEAADITMIQVDEPAIREGLPLRRNDWESYLKWAVDAFRLSSSGVADSTQVHTHMCYSEFGDIMPSILALDADVLSIETSRSKMELLDDFRTYSYKNDVGPGVYDIHSPRVPTVEEMVELIVKASKVLPVELLWVNPDCGLKTRKWPETTAALEAMVEAAKQSRQQLCNN